MSPDEVKRSISYCYILSQLIDKLTDEERLYIFELIKSKYCIDCGRKETTDNPCQCWNDE